MTISEMLKTSFPPTIKTENEIFSALVTNANKNGAIEKALICVEKYSQEYTGNSNVYNQTDSMLKKTATFFSFLEKYTDETDAAYIKRLKAIFYRGGDTVWGTPYNIIHVFNLYFPSANIFLCENTGKLDDNLIENFEFEDEEDNWDFNNSNLAYVSRAARFSKSFGAVIKQNGIVSQIVELDKTDYYLHFFMKGKCNVQITNEEGKYWNNTVTWDPINAVWEVGKWQTQVFSIPCESTDWKCFQTLMIKSEDTENIKISFIGNSDSDTYIDYVRLFEYKNPVFTLICHYQGNSDIDATALAPNNAESKDLDDFYYHDYNAFLNGVNNSGYAQDLYDDLLKYLKSVGVQSILEIVNRDEDMGE